MAQNWAAAMRDGNTANKYKAGIQAFQGNPMALAAADDAEQRYLTNVQNSVNSGKRRNALNAVPVERWRSNAMTIGANLLSTGAQRAMDKVTAHFNRWAPIYAQASAAAQALPKGGLANAMNRVQAAISVLMAAAGRS
jgi:hypothetical protein